MRVGGTGAHFGGDVPLGVYRVAYASGGGRRAASPPPEVRVVAGNDQRVTVPAATLLGGALVVVADTIARSAAAPLQLPVGVVTAMIGVPVFLWFIGRR